MPEMVFLSTCLKRDMPLGLIVRLIVAVAVAVAVALASLRPVPRIVVGVLSSTTVARLAPGA
jgi:hypothetical protein